MRSADIPDMPDSSPSGSSRGLSRRAFFTATGAGALGLYVSSAVGAPQAIAEISAPGVLPGRAIAKYAHPLLCPSDMPKSSTSGGIDQ